VTWASETTVLPAKRNLKSGTSDTDTQNFATCTRCGFSFRAQDDVQMPSYRHGSHYDGNQRSTHDIPNFVTVVFLYYFFF